MAQIGHLSYGGLSMDFTLFLPSVSKGIRDRITHLVGLNKLPSINRATPDCHHIYVSMLRMDFLLERIAFQILFLL